MQVLSNVQEHPSGPKSTSATSARVLTKMTNSIMTFDLVFALISYKFLHSAMAMTWPYFLFNTCTHYNSVYILCHYCKESSYIWVRYYTLLWFIWGVMDNVGRSCWSLSLKKDFSWWCVLFSTVWYTIRIFLDILFSRELFKKYVAA